MDQNNATTTGKVCLPNANLDTMPAGYLFHLDMHLTKDTAATFADVKFVCVGGTPGRMRSVCARLAREIYGRDTQKNEDFDVCFENERFSGYKMGAVFCVNHGMGKPSLSIMLHEVFKLLRWAGCCDVTIIRIGTCGGVGVTPGTVVITQESLDTDLKPLYHTSSFGERLSLPVTTSSWLIQEIESVARDANNDLQDVPVVVGKTYCTDDFYQAQGRLDGCFCDKTAKDRKAFLTNLYNYGVRNMEMESAGVLALAHKVGIPAVVVCAALVNRLESDFVEAPADVVNAWIDRPIRLVVQFIKSRLATMGTRNGEMKGEEILPK